MRNTYIFGYDNVTPQDEGSVCIQDEDRNDLDGAGYPSYETFTSTVRPSTPSWLRPILTTSRSAAAASEGGQYQCKSDNNCHDNASCQYDVQSRKYMCKCNKWYEGDGWNSCKPGSLLHEDK